MSPHLYLKPNAAGSCGKASQTGSWGRASGSRKRASHSGCRTFIRSDVNPAKELNKMATTYGTAEKSSLKEGVISSVENTKKNTDNVIRSRLMSELKLWCHKLDKSIGEMRSDLSHYHEESESKLKSLVRHTQEAHKCVQIIIDKQELDDTQKELAKLHLAQKDPFSSGGQNEERTSAPSSGPKKGTETPSDRHDDHHQQQVAPPQPSLPWQPSMELDDTQKELAKLHLTQKGPSSSGGQNEERTSAPSSGPRKGTETPSDRHDHHQQQQVASLQPSLPQQPYMGPPQPSFIPQQQITANQTTQYLPAKQTPQVNQQDPQQPVQSLSAYQQWPAQRPFVREGLLFRKLISKSIRALVRVKAEDETKLFIHVDLNKTYKTMSIIDNGIGMTKADLEKDGGLCSFLLAAKKIVVVTKHNKDEQYACEASRGDNCFKIVRDDTSTSLGRGTKITLFLDDDYLVYLEECCMRVLVDRYFKYINYKITIRNYDSSNKCQSGLVHISCSKPPLSLWYKIEVDDEVDAQKEKEFESRRLMAKALRKKVEKVVMSESRVSSKTTCTKSEALTVEEINPWEPNIIIKKLAELAAEDSDKYYKVLKKMIVCVGIIIGIISGCCTFPCVRRFVPWSII